jgi:hypothetical protein
MSDKKFCTIKRIKEMAVVNYSSLYLHAYSARQRSILNYAQAKKK